MKTASDIVLESLEKNAWFAEPAGNIKQQWQEANKQIIEKELKKKNIQESIERSLKPAAAALLAGATLGTIATASSVSRSRRKKKHYQKKQMAKAASTVIPAAAAGALGYGGTLALLSNKYKEDFYPKNIEHLLPSQKRLSEEKQKEIIQKKKDKAAKSLTIGLAIGGAAAGAGLGSSFGRVSDCINDYNKQHSKVVKLGKKDYKILRDEFLGLSGKKGNIFRKVKAKLMKNASDIVLESLEKTALLDINNPMAKNIADRNSPTNMMKKAIKATKTPVAESAAKATKETAEAAVKSGVGKSLRKGIRRGLGIAGGIAIGATTAAAVAGKKKKEQQQQPYGMMPMASEIVSDVMEKQAGFVSGEVLRAPIAFRGDKNYRDRFRFRNNTKVRTQLDPQYKAMIEDDTESPYYSSITSGIGNGASNLTAENDFIDLLKKNHEGDENYEENLAQNAKQSLSKKRMRLALAGGIAVPATAGIMYGGLKNNPKLIGYSIPLIAASGFIGASGNKSAKKKFYENLSQEDRDTLDNYTKQVAKKYTENPKSSDRTTATTYYMY